MGEGRGAVAFGESQGGIWGARGLSFTADQPPTLTGGA